MSELQLLGVADHVTRTQREITPAQQGLLDACSHADAINLLDALWWAERVITGGVDGGSTPENKARLSKIRSLTAWLGDVVEETH